MLRKLELHVPYALRETVVFFFWKYPVLKVL